MKTFKVICKNINRVKKKQTKIFTYIFKNNEKI